jgi:hypothetical protein
MLRLINFKGIVYCYRPRVVSLSYLAKKHNEGIKAQGNAQHRNAEKR